MAEIADVRTRGYAVNDQEIEIGLRSLAVPLFSAKGRMVGAVNVGLQAGSEPMAEIVDRYLPALLRLQDEVRKLVI